VQRASACGGRASAQAVTTWVVVMHVNAREQRCAVQRCSACACYEGTLNAQMLPELLLFEPKRQLNKILREFVFDMLKLIYQLLKNSARCIFAQLIPVPYLRPIFTPIFIPIFMWPDLHNPAIREDRRMTKAGFIANSRGISAGGTDLPEDLLGAIFDRIAASPISLKVRAYLYHPAVHHTSIVQSL
jgi:Sec7 domain